MPKLTHTSKNRWGLAASRYTCTLGTLFSTYSPIVALGCLRHLAARLAFLVSLMVATVHLVYIYRCTLSEISIGEPCQ